MSNVRVPIWTSPRQFAVKATGTSHYREALEFLAQNKIGEGSFCFFIAVLYPDNKNDHDPNAIAVMTQEGRDGPEVLGHLPREVAVLYRRRMEEEGYAHHISACGAALTGGLRANEQNYSYTLELDFDLDTGPHPENEVSPAKTVRLPGTQPLKKDRDGAYRFECWLPGDAVGAYHLKWRTMGWTTPHWKTVNYYLQNQKGIGLGFKLLSVSKRRHAAVFGDDPVIAVIEAIKDRWVTLRLEKEAGE